MSDKRRPDATMRLHRPTGEVVRIEIFRSEQWPTRPEAQPNAFRIRLDGRWWPEAKTMDEIHFASPYGIGQLVTRLVSASFGIPSGSPGSEEPPVHKGDVVRVYADGRITRSRALGDAARDPATMEWMVRVIGFQQPQRVDALLPPPNEPQSVPACMTVCTSCGNVTAGSDDLFQPCLNCGGNEQLLVRAAELGELALLSRKVDSMAREEGLCGHIARQIIEPPQEDTDA